MRKSRTPHAKPWTLLVLPRKVGGLSDLLPPLHFAFFIRKIFYDNFFFKSLTPDTW